MRVPRLPRAFLTAVLLGALPSAAPAQVQAAAPDTPYTLHVYEDLLQIPTLVLDTQQRSAGGLAPDRFTISLDNGPMFHPRGARPEGDDPIELALSFDLSDSTAAQAASLLQAAMGQAASLGLTSRDVVSVYGFRCELVRSGPMIRFSPAVLQQQLQATLSAFAVRDTNYATRPCPLYLHTWDVLAAIVRRMEPLPDRRVVYAFTKGDDEGSMLSWQALAEFADANSVAVMGFQSAPQRRLLLSEQRRNRLEDPFPLLCAQTGGTVLQFSAKNFLEQVNHATDLLRSRYILEFARPRNGAAGVHDIVVQTHDHHLQALPSGISFPPPSASELSGPDVVPSDPSRAPVLGSRRILTPSH